MKKNNSIAQTLKSLREEAGYSIERLAQFFDGNITMISEWENGTREPSIYDCCVLSGLYNISLDSMRFHRGNCCRKICRANMRMSPGSIVWLADKQRVWIFYWIPTRTYWKRRSFLSSLSQRYVPNCSERWFETDCNKFATRQFRTYGIDMASSSLRSPRGAILWVEQNKNFVQLEIGVFRKTGQISQIFHELDLEIFRVFCLQSAHYFFVTIRLPFCLRICYS